MRSHCEFLKLLCVFRILSIIISVMCSTFKSGNCQLEIESVGRQKTIKEDKVLLLDFFIHLCCTFAGDFLVGYNLVSNHYYRLLLYIHHKENDKGKNKKIYITFNIPH